ncbi:MAG: MoxR family ATPase [Deltaproteobacteria bacterium]|nr:MoxR family ATPase [Deltaproteobacteria bacterium]
MTVNAQLDASQAALFKQRFDALQDAVSRVIVGQQGVIRDVLIALAANGHVLLEGVPGLGKTLLVRTLSEALELQFSRVQFTPDLMPADIVGTHIISEDESGRRAMTFQDGPVFTQILLADEINRATPKTQSALLEAMAERSVTTAGTPRPLPRPFFVLATQNPLEMEGTYPLPEAQLDRFFSKVTVPFPTLDELSGIIDRTTGTETSVVPRVMGADELIAMQQTVRQVYLPDPVKRYALRLVLGSHPEGPGATAVARSWFRYGSSPRGAQAVILGARVRALLDGRTNVSFDDVRSSLKPALRHRVILNFEAEGEGRSPDAILDELLAAVPDDGASAASAAGVAAEA